MEAYFRNTTRAILLGLAVGSHAWATTDALTVAPTLSMAATTVTAPERHEDDDRHPTAADASPAGADTASPFSSTTPPSSASESAHRASPPTQGTELTPESAAVTSADASEVEEPSSLKAVAPYLKYGPWAILIIFVLSGIGLHLSEDFILIPAGFLIAHGEQLPLWETLIAAYVGLVIGDLLWILLCRRYGTRMVQSRWFKRIVHPRRLLEAKHQMELRGIMVVVLARFVPGTRTPTITMAGILHLSWWKLVIVEFCACAVTVPLQVGIGYLAGKGMGESKSMGELILKLVAATAAVALLGLIAHWWVQRRKTVGRAPRSKAAWLRTFGRRRRDSDITTSAG
jgi:membrane-associated protein